MKTVPNFLKNVFKKLDHGEKNFKVPLAANLRRVAKLNVVFTYCVPGRA